MANCFKYYTFKSDLHIAEVIAYGEVKRFEDGCCTNKLEIIREIPLREALDIMNSGTLNVGMKNNGNYNSGSENEGNRNTGDYNAGDWNSGYYNTGDYNTGDYNTGYCNSGSYNAGNCNSGNYNAGDYNTGDWNKANHCVGCFNTVEPKIYMFNKPSNWTTYEDWLNSKARQLMKKIETLVWIKQEDMTDEEKEKYPKCTTTGGYLKKIDTFEAYQNWWIRLSKDERNIIKDIPNFDRDIFKELTGIDVDVD